MGFRKEQPSQAAQPAEQQPTASSNPAAPSSLWGPQPALGQPSPGVQATQTHYGPAPSPPVAAAPAPVAQGYSMGPVNTAQPLYSPAQQVGL